MSRWVVLFLIVLGTIFGSETLKSRLLKAKGGDYFVFEAGKMVTFLTVRSITNERVLIEEITAPASAKPPTSWIDWVKKRAPGHTSWDMLEIDLSSGQIIECYSFSRSGWIQLSTQESFFATLLQLPLIPLPNDERKKIGPAPQSGEPDLRAIWEPPFIVEGKKRDGTRFDVYQTHWPEDETELAGKTLSLYFDRNLHLSLPLWIQIDTSHLTGHIRVIDTGRNFTGSPHRSFPRRVPQFTGAMRTKDGITLTLKSPKYYRKFELFAIDITSGKRELCPIDFSQIVQNEETLAIQIEEEELSKTLQKDHRYNWLLVPVGYSESYTETARPFTFR